MNAIWQAFEAVGFSLAYEEYRGDLARARRLADTAVAEAKAARDPCLPEALVASGAISLLRGEIAQALAALAQVRANPQAPPILRLRANGLTALALQWGANLFPDRAGAAGVELEPYAMQLRDGLGILNAERAQLRPLVQDPGVLLEDSFANDVVASIQSLRAIAAEAQGSPLQPTAYQAIAQTMATVQSLRNTARAAGPVGLRFAAQAELVGADLLRRAGEIASADSVLDLARQTFASFNDATGVGACLLLRGDWQAAPTGSPSVWRFTLKEAATAGSELAWPVEEAEFETGQMDLAPALETYTEAEKWFAAAGALRGTAAIELRLAYLALLRGDCVAAAKSVACAREGFEQTGDLLGATLAQAEELLVRVWSGDLTENPQAARAIGTWGRAGGSFSYALGLGLLLGRAGRYWRQRGGDPMRALACYRLAEELFDALAAPQNRIQSIVDQGQLYRAIGERSAAVGCIERALDLHEQARSTAGQQEPTERELLLLNELYMLALPTRDVEALERMLARARAVVHGTGGALEIGRALAGGLAAILRGGQAGAETAMARAGHVAVVELLRTAMEQASVLAPAYRAQRARERGDADAVRRFFDEALAAAAKVSPGQRDALEADVLAMMREYDRAAEAFRRHRQRRLAGKGGLEDDLLRVLDRFGGERGQAERQRNVERELDIAADFFTEVRAYADAAGCYEKLEQMAGAEWWSRDERPWETLTAYGETREGLGEFGRAFELYDAGIRELEQRRGRLTRDELKTSLAAGSRAQRLYFQPARLAAKLYGDAVQQGDAAQASGWASRLVAYAERGRARGLLDLMAAAAAAAGGYAGESVAMAEWRRTATALNLWRDLLARQRSLAQTDRAAVDELERRIAASERAQEATEARLAAENPGFRQLLTGQADILPLDELRRHLDPGTVLLQYYYLDQDLLGWAVTRDGVIRVVRAERDRATLDLRIHQLHRACADCAAWEEPAADLAEVFLRPFADLIRQHERIIIVPFGAAHELPFHVLPWEGQPLGWQRTVSYLPSASLLPYTSVADRGDFRRVLAIGNPARMSWTPPFGGKREPLRSLPGAELEAAFVASLFADSELLVGPAATEAAVLQAIEAFPLVHIATHGLLMEETPLLSSIMLANGDALSVYELLGLRLTTRLAVLSACHTARGERTGGDDVLGLTRALLAAGARSALVTLWAVPDVSTTLLMGRFFELLRAGEPTAPALRSAQAYLRGLEPGARAVELARVTAAAERRMREAGAGQARAGASTVETAPREVISTQAGPQAADYRHPHYWAPFVLVG